MQGVFLSLDGLDGTGKSTQCRLLAEWLRAAGHQVTECVDPGGTAIGQQIRALLLDRRQQMVMTCEMFLFMASRAQLTAEVIRPALLAGQIVLADRYLLANVVYQGHAGGLDPAQLYAIGAVATDSLQPDLTLVLDAPLELTAQRRARTADRVEGRDRSYHERVRAGFHTEVGNDPQRLRLIDASQGIAEVQAAIRKEVAHVLAAHPRT